MLLDIFDMFPNLLKSGFIGLVAIFGILFYFLFKKQLSGVLTTKDFLIRILPFILVSLLLVALSGYSIYTDKSFASNKVVDSLKTELQICKGSSPSVDALQKSYQIITQKKDSLEKLISLLNQEVDIKQATLNENIIIQIAESFEIVTDKTSRKKGAGTTTAELDFKRFKNATFQNILVFGADTSILRRALLVMKNRGAQIDVDRIVKATPTLLRLKRTWIKNALLQLENKVESMGPIQEMARIEINLPKEVWIINEPYEVTITEADWPRLETEKKLLDRKTL